MTLNMLNISADAFTAIAGESLDAGAFVKSTSSNDVVTSSGASSFAASDIQVMLCNDASSDYISVVGIAGNDCASGEYVTVFTRGLFIVRSGEAVATGYAVQVAEDTDEYEVDAFDATAGEHLIGKALTGASAADKYLVIILNI